MPISLYKRDKLPCNCLTIVIGTKEHVITDINIILYIISYLKGFSYNKGYIYLLGEVSFTLPMEIHFKNKKFYTSHKKYDPNHTFLINIIKSPYYASEPYSVELFRKNIEYLTINAYNKSCTRSYPFVMQRWYANMHQVLLHFMHTRVEGFPINYENSLDPNEPYCDITVSYCVDHFDECSYNFTIYKTTFDENQNVVQYVYRNMEDNIIEEWNDEFENTNQYINTNQAKYLA